MPGSASRSCRPTARRWRWSPIARTRRRATSSSSSTTLPPRSRPSRRSPRPRRSATRTRPGDRTARSCSTSATAATGHAGRRSSTASTWRRGRPAPLTGPGYLEPSFSPDGRYVVATKTSSFGNDLVILDAANGRELLRLTNDGASWAPVWSPIGDAIAFLHIEGQIVDLKLIRLEGDAPNWTVKDVTDLTEVSGLDGSSRPGWFVPPDQLPEPTPTPVSTAAPARPTAARRRRSDRDVPRTAGHADRVGRQRPLPRARPGPGPAAGRLLPGRRRRRTRSRC